jgi:hypothetical protein
MAAATFGVRLAAAVAAMAVGVAAALDARAAGDPAAECPQAQRLTLDLAAWKGKVRAARNLNTLGRLLGRAEPESGRVFDLSDDTSSLDGKVAVDEFTVQLVGSQNGLARQDKVVQVRFATAVDTPEQGTWFRWVQILAPLGPDKWCALGTGVSSAQMRQQAESCTERPGTVFDFVDLVGPGIKAIRTTKRTGACYGAQHGQRVTAGMWIVRDFHLEPVFPVEVTLEANWHLVSDPENRGEERGALSLVGEFPKQVTYQGTRTESKCTPKGQANDGPRCRSSTSSTSRLFLFDGAGYVEQRPPATPAPAAARGTAR